MDTSSLFVRRVEHFSDTSSSSEIDSVSAARNELTSARSSTRKYGKIELALSGLLPEIAPPWLAYDTVRQHAERYDSCHDKGLLSSSADAHEENIAFWGKT